jgi:hypothetical protein
MGAWKKHQNKIKVIRRLIVKIRYSIEIQRCKILNLWFYIEWKTEIKSNRKEKIITKTWKYHI